MLKKYLLKFLKNSVIVKPGFFTQKIFLNMYLQILSKLRNQQLIGYSLGNHNLKINRKTRQI